MILRDFKCIACDKVFEDLVDIKHYKIACPDCKSDAHLTITKVNTANINEFHPHYDYQLGQHFDTKEDKQKFLDKNGLVQLKGDFSPKKTTGPRVRSTKTQSRKIETTKLKPGETNG